jgi:hypothetical protein
MNPQAQEIYWSSFNKGHCGKRMAHHYLGDPQLAPDSVQMQRSMHQAVNRVAASADHREELTAIQKTVAALPERLRTGAFQRFQDAAHAAKEALPDDLEHQHISWYDDVLGRSFAADVLIEDQAGKVITIYEILKRGDVTSTQKLRMLFKGFVYGLHLNEAGAQTTGLRLMIMRPAGSGKNSAADRVLWDHWFDHSVTHCADKLAECRAHVQGLQAQISAHTVMATPGGHCNSCPFMMGCRAGKKFCFGSADAIPYSFASELDLHAAESVGAA